MYDRKLKLSIRIRIQPYYNNFDKEQSESPPFEVPSHAIFLVYDILIVIFGDLYATSLNK